MEALNHVPCDKRILACPEDSVSTFAPLAEEAGFELSPGSREDVLGRYCTAIRRFGIDRLIRATGDNPFVFADAARSITAEAIDLRADYAGYSGIPHGAGVECVSAEALLRAEQEAASPPEREHVCPYLYNHPERFLIHRPLAPRRWQGLAVRLTIDTPEDMRRGIRLYETLGKIPQGELRAQGETIIGAYRKTFGEENADPVQGHGR
jgi:spore coat polysaccharide biosynthesis protein SpsF